uniref:(northern house mosquito) hypothetical protein n=1 Tax=Culex pipiens TaxID=7175 RepID=A0A8D8BUD5_CULPI
MVMCDSIPWESKRLITQRRMFRFVGGIPSSCSRDAKARMSSSGSHSSPSTRSASLSASMLMAFACICFGSPTRSRSASEFECQFLISNPPRACTSFTSSATLIASASESKLSR